MFLLQSPKVCSVHSGLVYWEDPEGWDGGGVGGSEGKSEWGTHVNPWLIHVNVWRKPLQCCEVISLLLIKNKWKKKMFLLSLQLTAELGNDGKWKMMGNGFTPSISTYQGHSQSAMCRGGQCVAGTHVWALESGPGPVGFSPGSTTWEMCSHGKILSSLSPNFLFH